VDLFATALASTADTFRALAANDGYQQAVARAIEVLTQALSTRHKALVFGNGGSADDAQHIAAELVGRFQKTRPAIAAIALGTNPAYVTAWSNDGDYSDVFARELEAVGAPGDVAWGITTSGNSPNVVKALARARERGLTTIALTGQGGGAAATHADVLIAVPLTETARIQEVHLVTYHYICAAIEARQ
jgi:D-sedoheptulose 7-phosphate isomerase